MVSIAVPIDKAMTYFKIIAFILSILTITSIFGIAVFLFETGIYGNGELNILTLSGVVMLSIYLLPMILRPLDFLFNFKQYIIGLFSYIIMLPVFINIM